MNQRLTLVALACSLALSLNPAVAQQADGDAAQLAAASELFQTMQLEKTLGEAIEATVDLQIRQNPAIGPYRAVMLAFFTKYMSWNSLKEDVSRIYVASFSTEELRDLAAFYRTPVGAKSALLMPKLMNQGAELGMKRVQEHMPELIESLEAESKRLSGELPAQTEAQEPQTR